MLQHKPSNRELVIRNNKVGVTLTPFLARPETVDRNSEDVNATYAATSKAPPPGTIEPKIIKRYY